MRVNNPVINWFGQSFSELDPMIQNLHRKGGELSDIVNLEFGSGIAGVFGRKFGSKLGLPHQEGSHDFKVIISHLDGVLYWARHFNTNNKMISTFVPYGHYPTGSYLKKGRGRC